MHVSGVWVRDFRRVLTAVRDSTEERQAAGAGRNLRNFEVWTVGNDTEAVTALRKVMPCERIYTLSEGGGGGILN